MMALAVEGTQPSSVYWPKTPPPTPVNVKVLEEWIRFSSKPSSTIDTSHSTNDHVRSYVEIPMHTTHDCSNHEKWQPVNHDALQCEITCTMEQWTDIISALASALNGTEANHLNTEMTTTTNDNANNAIDNDTAATIDNNIANTNKTAIHQHRQTQQYDKLTSNPMQ